MIGPDMVDCPECDGQGEFDGANRCTSFCGGCGGCCEVYACERCEGSCEIPAECIECEGEMVEGRCQSIECWAERLEETVDLVGHLRKQREFSKKTFGPGARTAGIIAHIRKELKEVEAAPKDLEEWIDVVLLALDGAWRAGHEPQQIAAGLEAKQAKNEARTWPKWWDAPDGQAIEHDRKAG